MQVVTIKEESHGFIAIACDYKSAVRYLIDHNCLPCDVYKDEKWVGISETLGDNWADKLLSWDIDDFNSYFDGCFYLNEDEVYGI